MVSQKSDILLVGGGHAHVAILADWITNGLPFSRATLLTPEPKLRYSGMVPGWISGEYDRSAGLVDVEALANAAGVETVIDACVAIDPNARSVLTKASGVLSFDVASINTGGVGRARRVLGSDPRLLDVRPIHRFVDAFDEKADAAVHVAVVGGGAGGVEIAFAVRNRAKGPMLGVTLIAGADGVVPNLSAAVRRKVTAELERQGIELLADDAQFEDGALLAGGRVIEADCILAALGSGAPDWPRQGGLQCDEAGFIAVDRHQRSLSHPHIFAVGDVASRTDRDVPHSGVHAVFAGPVLADNLREIASGGEPRKTYRPRWQNLYLLSTARGEAIASYGPFAAQGKSMSRLKGWIDKRWIATYANLSQKA